MKNRLRVLKLPTYLVTLLLLLSAGLVSPENSMAASLSTTRLGGADRVNTAVQISKYGWPNNDSGVAIIVRDDSFPDALAGTPLAYMFNAPILLTNKDTLSPDTESELDRLNPKTILILGSYGAVSQNIENHLKSKYTQDVRRLGGVDRYDTAAKIAEYMKQETGGSTEAVVAYGENFPDALAVSSLAGHNQIPILLTQTNSLPNSTQHALNDLGVTQTLVVGGTGVISDKVLQQLPGSTRVAGSNRYETAGIIASMTELSLPKISKTLYIATGESFPDALAGAALACQNGDPILLVDPNMSNPTVINFLQEYRNSIQQVVVLGGPGAVPPSSVDKINGYVQNGCSYAPTLTSPGGQYIVAANSFSLAWKSIPGATMYSYLVMDMTNQTIVTTRNLDSCNDQIAIPIETAHKYKIKVAAQVNGNLYWGTSVDVQAINLYSKTPTLTSPTPRSLNTVNAGNDVILQWTAADPVFTTYKVVVKDNTSGTVVFSQYVTGSSATIPGSVLKSNADSGRDYGVAVCVTTGSDRSDPNYRETEPEWGNYDSGMTTLHVITP